MFFLLKLNSAGLKVTKVGVLGLTPVIKVIKVGGLAYDFRTQTLVTLVTGDTPSHSTLVTLVPGAQDLIK